MNDDIHELVNQVMQESQQDRRRKMIEDYISGCQKSIQLNARGVLPIEATGISDVQVRQEVQSWTSINASEVAYKLKEALGIILRQELLGEK